SDLTPARKLLLGEDFKEDSIFFHTCSFSIGSSHALKMESNFGRAIKTKKGKREYDIISAGIVSLFSY
ncbi:MAG: hypothetical protein LUO93_08725, partial [Methanomicrobiales archaeon]|nr:hypothetical protein [Methanomicrobiales archaeon]